VVECYRNLWHGMRWQTGKADPELHLEKVCPFKCEVM
jgi:hypothetical protein